MVKNTGKTLLVGKNPEPRRRTRLSLDWLRQRFLVACKVAQPPDRILMGWKAYSEYCWLLLGHPEEEVARSKFMGAEVLRDASIGPWDVVFGFTSVLKEQ